MPPQSFDIRHRPPCRLIRSTVVPAARWALVTRELPHPQIASKDAGRPHDGDHVALTTRGGRLLTRVDGLNRTERFEYDKNGNVTKQTDRKGQVTTLQYDALNRLTFAGYGTAGTASNPTS